MIVLPDQGVVAPSRPGDFWIVYLCDATTIEDRQQLRGWFYELDVEPEVLNQMIDRMTPITVSLPTKEILTLFFLKFS